jgi:hypothetical protein
MRDAVAIANIILGLVYTSYGLMTLRDLERGWSTMGFSHFGLAWLAMAFTCGPHHLEHGIHCLLVGRNGGPLDLFSVLVGFPAGAAWFSLRVEALLGGRGDRFISGSPRWVRVLPLLSVLYLAAFAIAAATILSHGAHFTPRMTPNVLLLGIYTLIGYYLLRTQLANRKPLGGWSVSGLALTLVFPTCGLMHIAYAVYASSSRYVIDPHGLVIDWLAVPAAVYFVWVVRSLHLGSVRDWNESVTGVLPEPVSV